MSSAPEGPNTKRRAVTLQQFLDLTAASSELARRRAISVALSVETPGTPDAYSRFYSRVLAELGVARGTDGDPAPEQPVPTAA